MALDSGEPFGLPKGTVRGTLALMFGLTLCQQTITHGLDIVSFIAVVGPFLGFYAATRPNEPVAVEKEAPLPAPSVPGDEDE